MKIRMNFVSNSSSTSYVIVLPDDFDIDSVDYTNCELDYLSDEQDIKKEINEIKKNLKLLIKNGALYDKWVWQLSQILEEFVVAEVRHGPDDGPSITVLNNNKIRDIWENGNENNIVSKLQRQLDEAGIVYKTIGKATGKFIIYLSRKLKKNQVIPEEWQGYKLEAVYVGKVKPAK